MKCQNGSAANDSMFFLSTAPLFLIQDKNISLFLNKSGNWATKAMTKHVKVDRYFLPPQTTPDVLNISISIFFTIATVRVCKVSFLSLSMCALNTY